MAVTEKEHFDALRAADQKAVELLATANAAKSSASREALANLIAIAAVLVAIITIVWKH